MGNMGLVVLEEFIHDRQTDRIAGYYIDIRSQWRINYINLVESSK
jgi:hypothetical protein